MSAANLTLSYKFSDDDDDFGWLAACFESARLSATGGFWVQWQDVAEWAEQLFQFPIPADKPVDADWRQTDLSGGNRQSIVRIRIAPVGRSGQLEVHLVLSDHNERRHRIETVFRTEYGLLERFATEVRQMMQRRAEKAVLEGIVLD